MKQSIKLFIAFVAAVSMFSCRPEAFKPVGDPSSNVQAITGTWQLTKVTQVDADARKKGFPYQAMDLTTLFPYTEFRMTLNSNGGTPTSFTTTPGNAPRIIRLASGNWSVDNPSAPKNLTLVNGTDTARVVLGAYPNGVSSKLKLRQDRVDVQSGKVLISYDYEFTKQ